MMLRHLKRNGLTVIVFSILVWALAGCTYIPAHNAIPPDRAGEARVNGFDESIRFWGDEAPKTITQTLSKRVAQYKSNHADYFKKHGRYPALNYLALSGGANDGAFAAGLLNGWSREGSRPEFALVTGVSTGALIAPFAFLGPDYDPTLKQLYTKLNTDNILKGGPLTILSGLFGGLALTDTSPLQQRIEETVTPAMFKAIAAEHRKGRRLFIATTNIEAQRSVIWDIGAIANSGRPEGLALMHKIMLASAAVPGVFPPVFIDVHVNGTHYNEIHADGGITSQVFLYPLALNRTAIDAFRKNKLERHLYIIRNSKIAPAYEPLDPGIFSLTRRSVETLIKYHGLGDLFRLYVGSQRDGIDYNLINVPEDFTVPSKEVFDPVYMSALFDRGYAIAIHGIAWDKTPPGVAYRPEDAHVKKKP